MNCTDQIFQNTLLALEKYLSGTDMRSDIFFSQSTNLNGISICDILRDICSASAKAEVRQDICNKYKDLIKYKKVLLNENAITPAPIAARCCFLIFLSELDFELREKTAKTVMLIEDRYCCNMCDICFEERRIYFADNADISVCIREGKVFVCSSLREICFDEPLFNTALDEIFEYPVLDFKTESRLLNFSEEENSVLVGVLRDPRQLKTALKYNFYHIPCRLIDSHREEIKYVAIYQSRNLFKKHAGIYYYGEVAHTEAVKRSSIWQRRKDSDERYYRFDVKQWKLLENPVKAKEIGFICTFTSPHLLFNASEMPELLCKSPEHLRLYLNLKKYTQLSINENCVRKYSFRYKHSYIVFERGYVYVSAYGEEISRFPLKNVAQKTYLALESITNLYN